ncbi:AAA family ATPase [Sphingobacterium phlebotomi]|uniref:AAA family ATPase n=1 Tax=Sphingobacterium phlebotomi TaxID=2605433 RepID=A0A5D4H4T2_9SPHI|nr:AAA family ATPase [Sphingobacterium phlebotomi]TYR35302.1 AAA family ATPase [Sphingobacterium phlebotomi]
MEIVTNEKAIVITGGPGMGKTSIIDMLRQAGYPCIGESGRQIIRQQLKIKGTSLPWADREAYAMEMFRTGLTDYKLASENDTYTFFDRGLPDVIGYLKLCELPVPDHLWLATKRNRYHNKVFITPPWPEIYVNDKERKQSLEEAIATYEAMAEVYATLGYTIIEIPKLSLEERVSFLINFLILS